MGKVIKSSAQSEERYMVAVPVLLVAAPRVVDEIERPVDAEAAMPAPAPVPEIDLEAINAQAQALVDDATLRAQALIDDAQRRAHEMLEQAAVDARVRAEETRREAQAEGYAGGERDAQAAMSGMIEAMGAIVAATRGERHVLLASAEPELVRLAVGIAERVLHQQIALDQGVVVEMARAAIARIVDREKITVRVNPADIEQMRAHRDELLALGDVKTMRVIEDQRVDRGGVILETDAGSIDAKISTQLAEVRKILHIVDDVVMLPAADPDESQFAAAQAS